jgi:DNA (cytosine-5)-methyltransferase 1
MGWEPVAFSEIEPFPCAVLAHHYPTVPNWGDMTKYKEWPNESIDILVGGTPCQSFSVAGLRKGLDDPRGNLMLTFLAIADKFRPEWLVWENVPGVLSSGRGTDFATFLGALGECGYGFAYRILDAVHFGVAQRRRRVFVIANSRDWRRAAAVLFERENLSKNLAPRRKKGKQIAPSVDVGVEMCGPLTLNSMAGGQRQPCVTHASVAVQGTLIGRDENSGPNGSGADETGSMFTLTKTDVHAVTTQNMQVRRLTCVECERLQGFPDGYTNVPYRNKPVTDGPRYRALGNSMAVPVMKWIGNRIQMLTEVIP